MMMTLRTLSGIGNRLILDRAGRCNGQPRTARKQLSAPLAVILANGCRSAMSSKTLSLSC